jgi:hypothetical protein
LSSHLENIHSFPTKTDKRNEGIKPCKWTELNRDETDIVQQQANAPARIRPCDLQKLLNSLKLKKACGIDGIPNECLRHLPR